MSNGLDDASTRADPYRSPRAWSRVTRQLSMVMPQRLSEARRIGRKTVALTQTRKRR